MLHLHYSNRLENLIPPLAVAVAARQRVAPLDPVRIVVPNRVVEQFVRYRLAELNGIAANLKFPFLRNYLADLLQSIDKNLKILDADELQLLLFECFRAARDDSALKAARDYVEAGSKTDADVELRTMLLAGQLARYFREYSISRRAMLAKWRAGRRSELASMSETERWQRHLWDLLFDARGRVRDNWLSDRKCRLMMLPDAFAEATDAALKTAMPVSMHVFGAPYVGGAFGEIFARLGQLGDLRIYAVNPCREFWEDVDTSRRNFAARWAKRSEKVGGESLDQSDDPFALSDAADPPALQLWGRPGREYVRLLNELSECDFDPLFSEPASNKSPTLLLELQRTILDREQRPAEVIDGMPLDDSIRFLACPGIRREAEIVANRIWSLMLEDDKLASRNGAERLRFHEIAVLIPDAAVDDYVPHLDSVFRKLHRIPLDIVSRSTHGASRIAEAIEMLLELPCGRFSRAQMTRLLTHPALHGETQIDVDTWRRWSESLGIFFGADDDDLKDTYIPRGLYHWDQAIKRLALGTMMTGLRDGDPQFYDTAVDGEAYLPFEVAQDELESASCFMRLARGLIADALAIRSARLSPRDWSRVLIDFLSTYLRPESASDEQARDNFLEAIESIADSTVNVAPMSFESARELIAPRVAELESRRGQFTGRGVAVGSFSSLRAIPFKVIFVVGLAEDSFPEHDRRDPLDLRTLKRRAADVTPSERDRYMFLETLLAARERVFLSYVARDSNTGDALEPSSVVRELQYILRGFVDDKTLAQMTVRHPISRYDFKYFPEFDAAGADSQLSSFDPDARRGARMLALREKITRSIARTPELDEKAVLGRLGPELSSRLRDELQFAEFESISGAATDSYERELALPVAAIRRYLECPLQGAARYALGMLEDDDAPEELEDEPVGQSRLDRAVTLRNVFWRSAGAQADAEYDREVQIARANGLAPAGQFALAARETDLKTLQEWTAQASYAGVRYFAGFQDIRLGSADEFADAREILPAISLDATIRRYDGTFVTRPVKIYGTIRGVSRDRGIGINCVLHKGIKAKDFLPPFLGAIVLSAAGVKMPEKFRAIVVGTESKKPTEWIREFQPMPQEVALRYLATVVGDLLSTGNHYFLPIEAVEAVAKERSKPEDARDLVEAVEGVLLNDFARSSSDYGPVRNATSFDPPGEEEIEQIFQRRFLAIGGIFK